ncbi:MAG: HEAT repeat domain-containing protein [Defluviicoccus sp.]|nr:HEAT repeat domain-containing protein [Defluviicoccus sp.]
MTRALRAAILVALLALPASREPAANGWEHAGIPYEVLIAALAYDDPDTRKRAAHTLGHRGQKEAVPHLLAALAAPEPDHGVRSGIYLALGRLGAPAAAPDLPGCLDRENREELRGDCAAAAQETG